MDNNWINKYIPKTVKDIIGHQVSIQKINNWIDNFSTISYSSVIISGSHGIGKSLTINLILKEKGYDPFIIYPNDVKDKKLLLDFMEFKDVQLNIQDKMTKKKSKKFALIIDETESITLTSNKNLILSLYKNNTKKKNFPFIFITNNKHSKLINDIKKTSPEIKFYIPNKFQIIKFIKKICKKESIKFSSTSNLDLIYKYCQNDMRRLLMILQDIKFTFNKTTISNDKLIKFFKFTKMKNIDIGLFDATKQLIDDFSNINNILQLYETEKVLLPLMIHENYLKKKVHDKSSFDDILNDIIEISDSISIGDNIETSIYTDQNWYLQNIHGIFTCVNTSYLLNKNKNSCINYNIKFSSDLNKTSLKNINRKNIINLRKMFTNKSIEEILIVNFICNKLIQQDLYHEVIKLIQSYKPNLNIKDIELFLKIDKTSQNTSVHTNIKKKFQKIFKNNNFVL